jgi:hypothetical protein
MYLGLTWLALRHNIDLEDEAALSKLANGAKIEVASLAEEGYNSVFVNSLEVKARVSQVSQGDWSERSLGGSAMLYGAASILALVENRQELDRS